MEKSPPNSHILDLRQPLQPGESVQIKTPPQARVLDLREKQLGVNEVARDVPAVNLMPRPLSGPATRKEKKVAEPAAAKSMKSAPARSKNLNFAEPSQATAIEPASELFPETRPASGELLHRSAVRFKLPDAPFAWPSRSLLSNRSAAAGVAVLLLGGSVWLFSRFPDPNSGQVLSAVATPRIADLPAVAPETIPTSLPAPPPDFVQENLAEPVFLDETAERAFPILAYQQIRPLEENADAAARNRTVTPENFARQIGVLQHRGSRPVTLYTLLSSLSLGAAPPGSIALTFDGGTRDFYERAFPVLRQAGFTATVFVAPDKLDTPGHLTTAQLREISAYGIEIGTLGSGENLQTLSDEDLRASIETSKRRLEEVLGIQIYLFSYPQGVVDARAWSILTENNFYGAVTLEQKRTVKAAEPFLIPRLRVLDAVEGDAVLNLLTPEPE